VNSRRYQISHYKGPLYRNTNYASEEKKENNHGSLNQLSKSDVVQTDRSNEAQNILDGYRINYIDVTYVGLEALQVPEKYEVKNGSELNDISTDELKIKKPPLNISVDKIINTPRRKCPGGQKMDNFGTCKTVWER
jgi:hypothetical protein